MVKIRAWAAWSGAGNDEDTLEVPDTEWAAMTEGERTEYGDGMVETLIQNRVDAGWEVVED